jgi:uncharacterized membrane protein
MPTLIVIWALGMSMVANAFILRLPVKGVAALGLVMIFGHNLLDGIARPAHPWVVLAWGVLHAPGFYPIAGAPSAVVLPAQGFFVLYPLVPWIFVMSIGFAFGALLQKPDRERRRLLWMLGAGALALFALLRATNLYGNPLPPHTFSSPGPFVAQETLEKTVILFFNVEKYPPSLQFLLMTLGITLLALAGVDRYRDASAAGGAGRFFLVFGQVPLFYYILHIYLVHALAMVAAAAFGQPWQWLAESGFFSNKPEGFGFGLPFIYLMWAVCVALLYVPCRAYANYKATHKQWWLSYL